MDMYWKKWWKIIIVILVGCSTKHEILPMSIETRINEITEWHEEGERVRFIANPSGTFWVNSARVAPEFWDSGQADKTDPALIHVAILADAFKDKDLVVIEFDRQSKKVTAAYPCKVDGIMMLDDSKEDRVIVRPLKSPSTYYLRKDHENFERIYRVLKQGQENWQGGVEVGMAVWGGEYSIEDAVIVKSIK